MAKYFELRNENRNVIVDDQFSTPKFLYKFDLITSSAPNPNPIKVDASYFDYAYERTPFAQAATLRGLGFDYDDSEAQIVRSRLMAFVRTESNVAFSVTPVLRLNEAGMWEICITAGADAPSVKLTICVYTTAKMLPSKRGLLVYSPTGELIFDALKGYLQHVAILTGNVNVGNAVAATYTTTVPSGMSASNLFISMRSALPYYAAYRISSSGVSYAYTYYYPRMTFPNATTMQVQLIQQRNVPGNNSATKYQGYFENVIYCPYPKGIYTGYVT